MYQCSISYLQTLVSAAFRGRHKEHRNYPAPPDVTKPLINVHFSRSYAAAILTMINEIRKYQTNLTPSLDAWEQC